MTPSRELSPILRTRPLDNGGYTLIYYCPGCQHAHSVRIGATSGPTWSWAGRAEKPTFAPSVKVYHAAVQFERNGQQVNKPEKVICHHFVREGQIEFLGDSTGHDLRGLHPMVPFPEGYGS